MYSWWLNWLRRRGCLVPIESAAQPVIAIMLQGVAIMRPPMIRSLKTKVEDDCARTKRFVSLFRLCVNKLSPTNFWALSFFLSCPTDKTIADAIDKDMKTPHWFELKWKEAWFDVSQRPLMSDQMQIVASWLLPTLPNGDLPRKGNKSQRRAASKTPDCQRVTGGGDLCGSARS